MLLTKNLPTEAQAIGACEPSQRETTLERLLRTRAIHPSAAAYFMGVSAQRYRELLAREACTWPGMLEDLGVLLSVDPASLVDERGYLL